MELREQLNRVYDAVNQIQDVREQLDGLKKRLVPGDSTKALFDGASALDAKLIAVRDPLINFKISASEDSLAYAPGIDAKLAFLSMAVAGFADSAPTESQYQEFDKLKKQTDELLAPGIRFGMRISRAFRSWPRNKTSSPIYRARCKKRAGARRRRRIN